jgi:DNA invertase Pin-like site-specific DNA recombinase
MKTSHVDRMAAGIEDARREVCKEGRQSFRATLDAALEARARVLECLRQGVGKSQIARQLGISRDRVQRAYVVLAREGKICWDKAKGGSGGWKVRNSAQ